MKCFVIMPFAQEFTAVYELVRATATGAVPQDNLGCYFLKDIYAAGKITDDIVAEIRDAVVCIADVTGSNPNVMWETGYAMALGKPTILFGQSTQKLPFDLHNHRVLEYKLETLHSDLGKPLAEAIQQTLKKYVLLATPQPHEARNAALVVAVTGSMDAHRARTLRRAEVILAPYLSSGVQWYCGSRAGEARSSVPA